MTVIVVTFIVFVSIVVFCSVASLCVCIPFAVYSVFCFTVLFLSVSDLFLLNYGKQRILVSLLVVVVVVVVERTD